jgi:Carboxypeptidase regulatory-like domain
MFAEVRKLAVILIIILSVEVGGQKRLEAQAGTIPVSGRIVSESGQPRAGLTVTFRKSTREGYQDNKVITDEKGIFAFSVVGHAEYEVTVAVPDKPEYPLQELASFVLAEGRELSMGDIVLRSSTQEGTTAHFAGPFQIKGPSAEPGSGESPPVHGSEVTIAGIYTLCSPDSTGECPDYPVHIVLSDGTVVQPPRSPDEMGGKQLGGSSLAIAEDNREAGWLADYPFCCASYPISEELVIYRPGEPMEEFNGDGRAIFDWHFLDGGKQVDLYQDFLHGVPTQHYELREVGSGRLLGRWDGAPTLQSPAWVKAMAVEYGYLH